MGPRLWLIGGTQESVALVRLLIQAQIPTVVTVTTESARSLYPISPHLNLWVGQLTPSQLLPFLQTHAVSAILDASHPFAAVVSEMAIAAAREYQLPYLRYERPPIVSSDPPQGRTFDSVEALLSSGLLDQHRVLLTLGYRLLPLFQPWQSRATLFARVLPSIPALEAALAAGFTPDRLIALRPPISLDLEKALWQQWQISMVVTKASGAPGGEDLKRSLAAELGIPLVAIARPLVAYPQQTSDLEQAIAFCQQSLPGSSR